ncbi:homoserine kinase [Paenibacillus turpanensis]|uniref:homoserine kinase n=1 Tax=Paenibacillus turpanensis TaxID=2689078 RepID=UPI00140A3C73|nr:homoserine kinase [Paenibacillus turpanensis]
MTAVSAVKPGLRVCAKVPASTANLGPGFDALGMALELYAWVEMEAAETTRITLVGDQLEGIPTDKSNLIYKVAQQVFARAGVSVPELDISIRSDIPLTRGLGSSAAAIVGGMAAANALIGSPLSDDDLFQMAAALEKHPDNVGAAVFGGIVVAAVNGERAELIRIEPPEALGALVIVPQFELATEKAREVLPRTLSLPDAVFNVGHASLLVAALASGRLDRVAGAMKDRIHEPFRASLVPGLTEVLEGAVANGAIGSALSGAGPTVLTLIDHSKGEEQLQRLEQFLLGTMDAQGIACEKMLLKPCREGVTVTSLPGKQPLSGVSEGGAKQ